MDNAEEVFNFLEEFSKRKPKTIPQELNDYLAYVARTGDPVYQWSLVKCLFKEKLLTVITDFYETTPSIEIPPYPNVDPFNYDIMKNSLLERLDSFTSAPFTVQRICELLTFPRKQYNRIDKFMRAVEKNILVVSTREPGIQRQTEPDNGEPMEPIVNGSDNNSEYNVDVEMEDMSWKENAESHNSEPQPGSSDSHISVDDIETRLQAKPDLASNSEEKLSTDSEIDDTSHKSDIADDANEQSSTQKSINPNEATIALSSEDTSITNICSPKLSPEPSLDSQMSTDQETSQEIPIPEIKVDDTEMIEQKIQDENMKLVKDTEESKQSLQETKVEIVEINTQVGSHILSDESSSDSNSKEEPESKNISEVLTSSEESSSSSDNNHGNSNSPKTESNIIEEPTVDKSECNKSNDDKEVKQNTKANDDKEVKQYISPDNVPVDQIQSDNYSISDVKSELPEVSFNISDKPQDTEKTEPEKVIEEPNNKTEEVKIETPLVELEKSES